MITWCRFEIIGIWTIIKLARQGFFVRNIVLYIRFHCIGGKLDWVLVFHLLWHILYFKIVNVEKIFQRRARISRIVNI